MSVKTMHIVRPITPKWFHWLDRLALLNMIAIQFKTTGFLLKWLWLPRLWFTCRHWRYFGLNHGAVVAGLLSHTRYIRVIGNSRLRSRFLSMPACWSWTATVATQPPPMVVSQNWNLSLIPWNWPKEAPVVIEKPAEPKPKPKPVKRWYKMLTSNPDRVRHHYCLKIRHPRAHWHWQRLQPVPVTSVACGPRAWFRNQPHPAHRHCALKGIKLIDVTDGRG